MWFRRVFKNIMWGNTLVRNCRAASPANGFHELWMVRNSLEDRAHIAFSVFMWLWWGGQRFFLKEKWKLWKRCCTRCPVGGGELKVTEAKMLPQKKALAVHVLDSAPTRAEANAWVASCSRSRGVHRRGKGRWLNFFSKVPGKGAIWSEKEALMNVTRWIQTSLSAYLIL